VKLRDYQEAAGAGVMAAWQEHDSTLVVMPTGTGKTPLIAEIIRINQPMRALVLVHRSELVWQASKTIEAMTGLECEVEMAESVASTSLFHQTPVVIGMIQTLISGRVGKKRMQRFDPMDFGLVIVDEAHHATAASYAAVLNHFRQNKNLKILGVTATPDRADEEALGQVFKTVAYDYEVLDAIHDGWLVPIEQQMVTIDGLDFTAIRTAAGDLNGADLAAVMEAEKNLQGIASATIEIIGNRRTLVFASSVNHAAMLTEIFNRHRADMARYVCGDTSKEERKDTFEKFSSGETQVLVNVGVATEGYDNPAVQVIVQARPTRSRSLYCQMIGRGTRPLPGVVDNLSIPEVRKAAIAISPKPHMLVIDFAGNSGRHKLITSADILGGKLSDEVIQRAVKRATKKGGPVNMAAMLEEEAARLREETEERKRKEAARKAHLVAKATYRQQNIDPFSAFDIKPERTRGQDGGRVLSERQQALLLKQGINPADLSYRQAKQLIVEVVRRFQGKLATFKQSSLLQKFGYETQDMTMADASKLIDALAKNGWRRPVEPVPA